ncbi:MAG: conjugal transfer protein TrbD [Candidatus Velthaea sp.]|jgi:type IV secretion system protein VirB3
MTTQQNGPRKIDVHLSLTRPLLMMGCEREPLMISAIIAVTLVFMLGNLVLAIAGVAFWVISVAVLGRMAKADSQMTKIYLRHVKYRSFYPAGSAVNAIVPTIKKQQ